MRMSQFKAVIPWERITKIKPVVAEGTEDISAVKKRAGCSHIINFGTYRFDNRALDSGLKLDGEVLKLGYTGYGFGIQDGRLYWSWEGVYYPDWFGQMYGYVKEGILTVPAGRGGKDGRIGVGITEDALILAGCDKDEGMGARTFLERNFSGCRYALEGDGSYSAQWITPDSRNITTRRVVWYLCAWTKEEEQEGGESGMNIKGTCTAKTSVYDANGKLESGRYIAKGDVCEIGPGITGNLLIPVEYPVTSGTRKAYLKSLVNFRKA